MALKASYLATGLTIRVHGNAKRLPKHALKLDKVKNLVTFPHNYAEKNAILLPGWIPGCKRDDLQLLPSNTMKKVPTLTKRPSNMGETDRERDHTTVIMCTLHVHVHTGHTLYIQVCIASTK